MSSETLVISSELSKDLYPENNGGSFKNELAPPLVFESGHVKINDLAYVPGSWDNVRENSNEITIQMRGCPVWGLVYATLYHSGEITFETGTRKNYRRNTNREFRNVDVYRAHISIAEKTTRWGKIKHPHTSDWTPGKPFDVNVTSPIPTLI